MRHLGLVGVLAIAISACADATDETQRVVVVRPPDAPQAWVAVEATQTECCYDEGSTALLEITNRDGFRMVELSFANPVRLPNEQFVSRFDRLPVGLGPHTVMLWQEDCGDGCPWDEGGDNTRQVAPAEGAHRLDLCAITIDIAPGETAVEARGSPFVGCQSIQVRSAL